MVIYERKNNLRQHLHEQFNLAIIDKKKPSEKGILSVKYHIGRRLIG
jgi:hypothetical protein